jgi:GNAT superfamily N-acetyltransferase
MIQNATTEDLPGVLSLYQQLFPEEDYNNIDDFRQTWSEIVNDKKIRCFISFEGIVPVATCIITIIPNLTRNQRPYAIIENVVTHRDYRKLVLGKAIIDKAVEYATEENCYKVMLLSSSKRGEAHKFYKKIGFDADSKKGFQIRLP